MTLDHILHRNVRRFLERKGIEGDSMSRKDNDLFIECDDLETAFDLREITLQYHPCCLVTHPASKLPTLMIHSILNQ
jgi:hypothetical protein